MNAREVRGDVSGYEGKGKRKRASVMWSTGDLGRRKVGGRSVMQFAREVRSTEAQHSDSGEHREAALS